MDGRPVPFLDVFLALSRGEPHLLLPDGAYFSLDKPELRALARLIEEARALQDAPGGPLRISRYQAGLWDELAALGVIGHQAGGVAASRSMGCWRSAGSGPSRAAGRPAGPAAAVSAGRVRWLAFLWEHRLGGILADDMGLGKTLQSPGADLPRPAAGSRQGHPFLIVAPASVVANWAAEAARFAPDLTVVTISGTLAPRAAADLGELAAGADVVVTSYTLLRIDFDAYAEPGWSGLISRRGPVRQEPPVEDLPVRAAAGRAVQARDHRHPDGEQPDGAVVAAVDHRAWAVPQPGRGSADYYAKPDREGRATPSFWPSSGAASSRWSSAAPRSRWPPTCRPSRSRSSRSSCIPRHRKLYQTRLQRERQKVLGLLDDMTTNRFTILRSLTLLRQLSLHRRAGRRAHDDLACGEDRRAARAVCTTWSTAATARSSSASSPGSSARSANGSTPRESTTAISTADP